MIDFGFQPRDQMKLAVFGRQFEQTLRGAYVRNGIANSMAGDVYCQQGGTHLIVHRPQLRRPHPAASPVMANVLVCLREAIARPHDGRQDRIAAEKSLPSDAAGGPGLTIYGG